MKATGIVRRIDDLGRVVIPKELRKTMDMEPKEPLELFVEDDKVILKKYQRGCVFCGNIEGVKTYKGKEVCVDCIEDMKIENE